MESTAREIAFMIDEDGTTTEELRGVLADMANRIRNGEDTATMLDNYYTLRQAERELSYWEGTAAEYEGENSPSPSPSPSPLTSNIYVVDDNRGGISREQVLRVTVDVLEVMGKDLEENGFSKVATIVDEGVSSRSSVIYYKPSRTDYIPWEEHVDIVSSLMSNTYRRGQ